MIHIGDGTWNLRVFITDLHVEKTLRVKGDLHIGGVMLRLVDPGWFNFFPLKFYQTFTHNTHIERLINILTLDVVSIIFFLFLNFLLLRRRKNNTTFINAR